MINERSSQIVKHVANTRMHECDMDSIVHTPRYDQSIAV